MIKIYQGTQKQIDQHLFSIQDNLKKAFVLYNAENFPVGFYGLRMLIHYLKEQPGNEVQRIVEEHKAIGSFIFPELEKDLSETEKKEYVFYCARLESRLNVPYALFEKMAEMMAKLIGNDAFEIIIPNLRMIDPESLRVIENYYRHHPENKCDLLVGFATDIVDTPDKNGITWERSQGDVQYFIGGFNQYPDSEVINITDIQIENENNPVTWNTYHPIHQEKTIFHELKDDVVPDNKKINDVIAVMSSSYERFSFRAVVMLGLRVLSLQPEMNSILKSYIHSLVGSAASFYQFSHHPNPPFDSFLVEHLEAALSHENRPEIRTALLYRITFTYAERKEDVNTASIWAEKFVREANAITSSKKQRDYHLAWAYNVRAHIYAHLGMFEKFAEDGANAYTLLEEGIKKMEKEEEVMFNAWLNDYKLSIFNLSIHQVYIGDEINQYAYSKSWHKKMPEIMKLVPEIMLFDTFHWIDFHRNKFALHNALKSAEKGIEDAKNYKHGQIYVYTFCAADFSYRIGNASKALTLFKKAEEIRPFYNDLFYIYSMPWFIGNCYMKMEEYEKAEAAFTSDLEKNNSKEYQVMLYAILALISARKGNKTEFEDRINMAIDEAVEYGEQNLLIKIALTAAFGLYLFHDEQAASEALEKVEELAATPAENGKSLNDAYLFEMHLYHLVIHGYHENHFLEAIKLLRGALNDIETWWLLPSLKPFVHLFEKDNPASLNDPEIITYLNMFYEAFSERVEATEIITQLS